MFQLDFLADEECTFDVQYPNKYVRELCTSSNNNTYRNIRNALKAFPTTKIPNILQKYFFYSNKYLSHIFICK